jgi:hypothetical protein
MSALGPTRTSGDVRFPAAGEAACVDLNQIYPYAAEHSLRRRK